jgi:hypothetical protein
MSRHAVTKMPSGYVEGTMPGPLWSPVDGTLPGLPMPFA